MADKIQLPNGAFFPVKEGESKEQALAVAKQMYPDAFAAPVAAEPKQDTSGFKAAASAGFTRLGGEMELLKGKLGVKSEAEAQKEYEAAQQRAQKRFTPTEKGFTEDPLLKFRELLGGSVPYAVAPAAAGLAALAAPVSIPVAAGLGLGAAGAVSAGQFTAANLAAQMETGKSLEEASLGKAAAAAVPQALLDTAAMALLPGVGKLFGSVGAKLTTEQAKAIASQTLARTAADYAAKTGTAMGREGFTEAAQQVLERLQAGLEITDPEARKEYIDSFIGGAVLGGTLAPVGRAIERGGAKSQAAAAERKERLTASAEEQRVAAEAAAKEAERKQSPAYALQVADEYAAAEKAKAALLAQKRTVTKGSPTETADKAFNQALYAQVAQLAPELKALGAEYARLEPKIKEAKEQKRVEGLTPEEFSLEQMQADLASTPTPRTREERLAALNAPIEAEEAAPTPEAGYAADRIALAKEQMGITTDVGDYVAYLMTDPRMAQSIVDNQTGLPGLKRKEQNAVLGALKLQLQARAKQQALAGKAGTTASQERVGTIEAEEAAALEEQRLADEAEVARLTEQREEQIADIERERRIAPEVEGIRRLGKAPEGTWNSPRADELFRNMYQKQLDEQRVDALLATLPLSSVTTPGQIYAGMGFETASRRDLLTRMAIAKAHAGVEDVTQLQQELASLDTRPVENTDIGARLPGEGVLPEAEKKTIEAEKIADMESQTLREFIRFLEDRKQGKPRGTLRLGRKERLESAGTEFKSTYAKQHIDETNARLEAFGLPKLTATEQKIAEGRVMRNLNELEQRWAAADAAPAGRGAFGAPLQAVEVLQEQIRSGMFKTINEAADRFNLSQAGSKKGLTRTPEGGARLAVPDELTLRAESTVPKDDRRIATETAGRLLRTLDTRTYATPETPAPKGKEGSNRADMAQTFGAPSTGLRADISSRLTSLDEDTKDFVRLAADTLDQIEDEALITRLKEGLQDVAEGRKVSALTQQELKDFVAARAKDVQSTTRPGATPEELQRTSAQPQMSLSGFEEVGERTQRATAKNFQKMLDSKDVQGLRAAIEKMRTDNIEAIQEAARNTPAALRAARTAKARVDYNAALARAQQTTPVAKAFEATVIAERANAKAAVDVLKTQLEAIQMRIAEVVSLRDMLAKEPTDMSLLIRAPSVLSQEPALNKRLSEVSRALENAEARVLDIDKQQAATKDVVTKAIEESKQAEQDLVAAQKELTAANKAEREAEVEVKQIKSERDEFRESAQRLREGLDLPGLRSTVDTTKMKLKIINIRSEMGAFNALIEKEKDPEKKAEYQRRYDAAEKKLDTVYADAPRITTAIKEKDQLAFEKAFDDAQIAAYDKQSAKRRIRGGEYGPALSSRRQGAIERKGPLTVQTGEKKATPATEMAGSALERVAQERAALRELEDRVAYLRSVGKDKVKGRLTEMFKALKEKVAKQKALVSEFEAAQQAVVAAVRDVNKAERDEAERDRKATAKAEAKGTALFSRGVPAQGGQTVASLEKALDKVVGDPGVAGKRIKIFQSVSDLFNDRAYKYDYEGAEIPADAKAFVNPKNGQVFMFADNIGKGEELGVLLHEIGVHIGFRNLFNKAQYARLVAVVKGWNSRNDNSLEARIAKRAVARVEAAETTADQYDDELLAYTVEEAIKAGVNPDVLQGGSPIRNWLKSVVDVLRNALAKYGINSKTMTTGDLVNMAYGAAQLELRGTWHGSDATFTAFNTQYAGAGEGAFDLRFEAEESLGAGPYVTPNKEYAEYYQHAVPFGKAANESGYGTQTYQDYRALDEMFLRTSNNVLSTELVQGKFESRLITAYLEGVSEGQSLDPTENKNAKAMLSRLQKGARDSKEQDAVKTLSLQKIKALKEYPSKGNLYRTLDDIPRSRVYSVNSNFKVGERPAMDALLQKYGDEWEKRSAKETGEYPANTLFFRIREKLGIKKTTGLLKAAGIEVIEQNNERGKYVERAYIDQAPEILGVNLKPVGPATGRGRPGTGTLLFSRNAPTDALEALALQTIAQPPTLKEKIGNNLALRAEMNASDMRAGLREALKFGDDKLFTQAMYAVRKAEQKMAQMFTVMNSGPLVTYKDSKGLTGYRSSNENSAVDVFDAIADIPKDDPQMKMNVAQAYLVARRAENKGLSKLDLGELGVTQEALDAALAAAEADPKLKTALENVRRKYNAYNRGLIEFLASTGRITKKAAADLLKDGDYVPYYRVSKNGEAFLNFGNNVTFNVGDIRRQPYLAELKGGETKLLPLNEAIQQNTLLLTDMALTNNAAKNVGYGLQALGKGKGPGGKDLMAVQPGFGPAGPNVVRFYQEPDPTKPDDDGKRHVVVETKGTAAEGIPAELVVQSLEGTSLALPGFLKMAGAASDLLRAGVTRNPLYIARKLVREPMAAAFTGGLNSNAFSAVFKAGAEFVRMSRGTSDTQAKLIEKGLIQSNIFSGDMSDMQKMALQLASGKDQNAFEKVLAAADRYAMRADAATLALVLKNAEENGLSDVEADMMTMESMNLYKRGLSPTLQYASRLIPFFTSQIQGLSVLIKAARGNMPFEEQQQIKRKFFNNAVLLTFTGLVYAMAMEDDETFRNARPRDKYSNFFLPLPGVDEPLKLPIPFEAGYFFSLAVAAVDGMRAETDGQAQWKAVKDLFLGSIPGYSSMGVPQIAKPVFEVWANKNFMTGAPVESLRLQGKDPEDRYLATTTELAKDLSKVLPVLSPIQIEHLVRGYLGVLPLVAAAGANSLFEGAEKGARAEGRASDLPLLGSAFQKKYGGGDADVVYREAQEAMQARTTLNDMLKEGRREEAAEYRERNKANLAMSSAAGQYRQVVGRINEDIRRTQARKDLTPEEKRIRLDALDKAKQERADAFITMSRKAAERMG